MHERGFVRLLGRQEPNLQSQRSSLSRRYRNTLAQKYNLTTNFLITSDAGNLKSPHHTKLSSVRLDGQGAALEFVAEVRTGWGLCDGPSAPKP